VHVLLAAGGTAGHVEPALNLADALRRLDGATRITVLGGERGLESALVPARGYELVTVPSVPMPRRPGRDLIALGPRVKPDGRPRDAARPRGAIDVLVIGGGNAALCAALTAREAGASVLMLEAAPRDWRGGNSIHTRNLRCMHDAPQDVLTGAYPEEEFWQDLRKVTGGQTSERLARLAIRESSRCRDWMHRHGVRFQPSLSGTLHPTRTNASFMGGGLRRGQQRLHREGLREARADNGRGG